MDKRIHQIKQEIIASINASPEALHSVGGLTDRFDGKITRPEIERAVACLLAGQHIKKLGAHVFGFGNGGDIKPFDMTGYDPLALKPPVVTKPAQKKTMQQWSGGDKNVANTPPKPAAVKPTLPASKADTVQSDIVSLANKLKQTHITIVDLELKLQVLTKLSTLLDNSIGDVLAEIKTDLEEIAA